MFDRVVIKERAKEYIKGDIKRFAIIGIIASIVGGVIGAFFIPTWVYSILGLITSILSVGIAKFCLNKISGKEASFEDLTLGFNVLIKVIIIHIVTTIGVLVGGLIFVIPGVIFAIMVSFSFWILAEDPTKGAIQCMRESIDLTTGAKLDIFITDLSFMGWNLLLAVTFGIANILVEPYISLTYGQIYIQLKEIKEAK